MDLHKKFAQLLGAEAKHYVLVEHSRLMLLVELEENGKFFSRNQIVTAVFQA